jgi:chromosomal replication initiation ATPase DnaA
MTSMDIAELFTGYVYTGDIDPRPTGGLKTILKQTAADYNLDPLDLFGAGRGHWITKPRQDFMWRARQVRWSDGRHRYSLPQIGEFLGGRDHTTILWGIRQHEKRRANYCDPMATAAE